MMPRKPFPITDLCKSLLGLSCFGLIVAFMFWIYEGFSISDKSIMTIILCSGSWTVGAMLFSVIPLLKVRDEYLFARTKFRFFLGGDKAIDQLIPKLKELGYEMKSGEPNLYVHTAFPHLDTYTEKKHPIYHYLQVTEVVSPNGTLLELKAWPLSPLIAADWKLVIHDSLNEIQEKCLSQTERIPYKLAIKYYN